ncbi:HlyD family efflux transporter periplasmic adaptor subunit [Ramlibacter sp. GTP1]|uniref:HlyD family efflux transporter periplasmic adaptor subunit n=1 Tax=Ramlibacter albus TaxID=2079448 RepID=A0A923MGA8_9BURK|nr:HlyD family efflux transporter periplasmic adaptor subunit [Ramlibacter albus]MBC5768437.1 HlyD family efflux transporter periplasmic adaptor subunit [Ramlibacter albus]
MRHVAPVRESSWSAAVIWLALAALLALLAWAHGAELDEVVVGAGKVVPTSREQVIQSLEGGIVARLHAAEGDIVQRGQPLADLDKTRATSAAGEGAARLRSLRAQVARLVAEVGNAKPSFPEDVQADPVLVQRELALLGARRSALGATLEAIEHSSRSMRDELAVTEPLVAKGAAGQLEVVRLRRGLSELDAKAVEARNQFTVKAREELAKASAELESLSHLQVARADSVARTTLVSPVRGVVKDVQITTVDGVLAPGGKLMEIVPLDDQLRIEVRVDPRDIAHVRPGLATSVKFSAYDYSVHGSMQGVVSQVSPDTLQDEIHRERYYYRVWVKTDAASLVSRKSGAALPLVPGMMATVDIHTGQKTVMQYLLKPFNHAREAMRER